MASCRCLRRGISVLKSHVLFHFPPKNSDCHCNGLPQQPQELAPEAVSAAWLSALGRALLAHLTDGVLPSIRMLSSGGAAQLASDLGYLTSIIVALGIESPELERWKECVELDDESGKERLKEEGKGDEVLATVARLRGWV